MTPPIAILGAGPSGLALGRLLEVANIDYCIFERDEHSVWTVGRGGTLDLHTGSGQLALSEAGLMDQFRKLARFEPTNKLADMTGKVYISLQGSGDQDRPEIDRKTLQDLLFESISPSNIRWGKRVEHVYKDADGTMSIRFADESIETGFQLVVGADGAWSKARSLVSQNHDTIFSKNGNPDMMLATKLTSAKPQYHGLYFLTTRVSPANSIHSKAASLAGRGNYMAYGEGKQIAAQLLGDDSYYIAVGISLPENWGRDNAALLKDPAALRQRLVKDHFANWPKVHTDLVEHSDGQWYPWPLYHMPTESLSWKTVPGVTLIGDAAHVSTPFVGEGVNCSLHDSVQLAQQIRKYGLDNLGQAVEEYEKLMFPRAIDLIERSQESGKVQYAEDSPRSFLRWAGIEV